LLVAFSGEGKETRDEQLLVGDCCLFSRLEKESRREGAEGVLPDCFGLERERLLFGRVGERKQKLLVLAVEGSKGITAAPLLLHEDQRKEQGVQRLRKDGEIKRASGSSGMQGFRFGTERLGLWPESGSTAVTGIQAAEQSRMTSLARASAPACLLTCMHADKHKHRFMLALA
jgi:hypothetical protein